MAPAGSTILTEGVLRGVIDDTTVAVFGGLVAGRGGLETARGEGALARFLVVSLTTLAGGTVAVVRIPVNV